MEGAIESTLRYVKERSVFGKALADYQNTRFKLAEVATIVRIARVFIDDCVMKVVGGQLDTVTASMAKWWISDMHKNVMDTCVQCTAVMAT
jgi:acyl-CoA dehydrogenase